MERTLKDLSVEGVKTRKKPNKHIVFSVKVMWSDGQVNVVSRRYSEFFELMEKLNEKFPLEAGKHEHNKRILPNLQAKKTFLVSSRVMKQLERITHFTKELVLLPDHISQCTIVRNFFTPTEADIVSTRKMSIKKPKTKSRNYWRRKSTAKKVLSISGPVSLEQYRVIADVVDKCNTKLDLKEGQVVEVIEKLETGWWLVTADGDQGWVPASYLSNEDDPEETMTTIKYQPGQGECYVTSTSYTATLQDELSFDIGVHLQVIEKNLDGWWRAIYNGCEGLVPAAYLTKVGDKKSKPCGKKPPPVRKQNVLSQRYSVSSQQGYMTDETLAKLRESTFKSPEEKEEQSMLPKRKLARAEQRKVSLELKTSTEGGWVPQVPATPPPEKERKTNNKEKGFRLLKGFGTLRNSHLPERSESAVSDWKFLKKSRPHVAEENGMFPSLVEAKQAPRRKSMVEGMMTYNGAGQRNEKATRQGLKSVNAEEHPRRKSMAEELMRVADTNAGKKNEKATRQGLKPAGAQGHPRRKSMVEELMSHKKNEKANEETMSLGGKVKYIRRWSCSGENNFHMLPWENEDERNEYVLSPQQNRDASRPKQNIRSLSELSNAEFSPKDSFPVVTKKQGRKNSAASVSSDSPVFFVTPPTPQANKKPRKTSEGGLYAGKTRLHRKKSYSCSDLASSANRLEGDAFKGYEDDEDFHLDEDDESSDEDVCTLEDLLNEEKESKGNGIYYENLLNNKRKMSRERESFDSGLEGSPPSSPATTKMPHRAPASNMYVAIADYKGLKEEGEVDLFEGQQVRVLKKTVGGWWLVEDDEDQSGWAPSNFLEHFKPDSNKQLFDQTFCYVGDATQSANVSEDFERNVIELSDGQELEVVDTNKNGHFMLVRVPSKFAWISKSSVVGENGLPQCKV